ncbi:glycine-rich domain-containing protein [Streptomyces noursei]
MTTAIPVRADARALVSEELFGRLVARIVKDERIEEPLAERIMTDALAFLAACGANQGSALGPSEQVDIGWHTFLMYTEEYADFCERIAGRFIHHSPADVPGVVYEEKRDTRLRSIGAMRALGYEPDPELWGHSADCSQCHNGCSESNYAGK